MGGERESSDSERSAAQILFDEMSARIAEEMNRLLIGIWSTLFFFLFSFFLSFFLFLDDSTGALLKVDMHKPYTNKSVLCIYLPT